jgi:hypothetical protein
MAPRALVEESYRTARGRQRRRVVAVDVDAVRLQLFAPGLGDLRDWQRVRERLAEIVGQSVFDIWFDPLRLRGVCWLSCLRVVLLVCLRVVLRVC